MEPIEVFINHRFSDEMLADFQTVSPRLQLRQQVVGTPAEYGRLNLSRVEAMFCGGPLPQALSQMPRLRWVQLRGAGVDGLADHPLRHADITVTNGSGVHATPIAEHVLASILAWNYRFPFAFRSQQRREWAGEHRWEVFSRPGLRGMTLGIVGYGSIGREVGRLGAGFGMRVLACNRSGKATPHSRWHEEGVDDPDGSIPAAWYSPAQLDAMLPECGVVVIAAPLTEEMHHLIGREVLAAMKPTAYLVNIARGGIVDQEALIEALREKRIGGAGLDVTTPEPLPPESPLWHLENVILTPHVSGAAYEYDRRMATIFKENLHRFVAGETLLNVVDWEAGY